MRQLSDLLNEAKADAPPTRVDVDDVVAAGRRRVRRRNAGWAIGAVAAVAVAIGVPQIVTRADPAPQPVTPHVTTPAPAPSTADGPAVRFTFAGYTAGAFRVSDPIDWGLAGETAAIRRAGSDETVGALHVYRAGVEPFRRGEKPPVKTRTAPVHGRPAYFVEPATASHERSLLWEYADGALAMIEPEAQGMGDAQLRQVAEAFEPGPASPVRIAFTARYVTGDYTLVGAFADPSGAVRSAAYLVPADQAEARMREPDHGLPPDQKGQAGKVIAIRVSTPAAGSDPTMSARITCIDGFRRNGELMGGSCGRPLSGGKYVLEVTAGGTTRQSEIRKMLDGVTAADPAQPSTWVEVNTAIPATHLLARY
ncbi:hypothetical protein ACQP2F_01245 [Actinoplanes sp. CA-030573]|uniref:hypothetical protein n=1 Tax=Actinoplanes sp. CA-030573 TaxID=3239898 RepID=UPI003D8C4766